MPDVCRCRLCRQLDEGDDVGPPLTAAQASYAAAFIAWVRGNDFERERIELVLEELRQELRRDTVR